MSYFDEITMAAFSDEIEKIAQAEMEKAAGIGDFFMKGIKGWQSAARGAAQAAKHPGVVRRGATQGKSWGSHFGTIKKMYQQGANKGGGVWGGVKRVAKSPYGAMAGTAGVGGLAAYGGYKALPRFGSQQQQRY